MERLGRGIFVKGALSEGAKETSVDHGASCKLREGTQEAGSSRKVDM